MIDLAPPPHLYVPARPAIIRAHQGDLEALAAVERRHGFKAMLPGMVPIIAGGAKIASLEFLGLHPANAFTGLGIGEPSADRVVVVVAQTRASGSASPNFSSMTINGSTALVAASIKAATTWSMMGVIGYLPMPEGDTANVAISWTGGAVATTFLAVYVLRGLKNTDPFHANAAAVTSTASTISTTVNVPDNGVLIASYGRNSDTGLPINWVGATKNDERILGGTNSTLHSTASAAKLAAQTGRTVSGQASATSGDRGNLVVATWS